MSNAAALPGRAIAAARLREPGSALEEQIRAEGARRRFQSTTSRAHLLRARDEHEAMIREMGRTDGQGR